jgi:hypothetical protein
LAREWTRIPANPWRAVLRGSPRSRRAGAVAKKYISRSHKAHEGGKPEIRFWPANGRKSPRILGGLSSVAAPDSGAQAPLRKNTSSHGAAKHTEGENRKADFGPRMDANPRESLEGCPPWQPKIQARRHRCEKIHPLTEPQSTRRWKTGKQILAREWTQIPANPWRAVLRGSHRFSRAGAVAKKYILSRSHKAHGGGKPKSRFWPATPIPAGTSEIDMRCRFPLSVRVCSYE